MKLIEITSIVSEAANQEAYGAFVKMHKKIESLTTNPQNKENNAKARAEWTKVIADAKTKSPSNNISELDDSSVSKLLTRGQSIINYYHLE